MKPTNLIKFTIVTPSLNQGTFIGATIESIFSQSGDFQIEYFVQDGGSTDNSIEIIRGCARKIASGQQVIRCRGITLDWNSRPDKGQSEAINIGLKKATGDIVTYLNSDDLYFPGTLQQVASAFQAHPEVDFVHGDGDFIDEEGKFMWEWLSRPYDHKVMTSYHYLWNRFTNYINQTTTFWRREVLDKIGYLDESFHYSMDTEYWVRAGHHGLKFMHIPKKLGKHRFIKGTKTFSSPTVFWEDSLEMYRRYRRPGSLSPILGFYYYNLILNEQYDLEKGRKKGEKIFERWKDFPPEEQRQLRAQGEKGWALANLLISGILARQGQKGKAGIPFRRALEKFPGLLFHPFALSYLLRKAAPARLSFLIERFMEKLIFLYRDHRYEYRYKK